MSNNKNIAEVRGLLGRLRSDVRGNMLALMAALLVPLMVLSGSAVDLARMYSVKTRLQQACDAGALAGRKMMNDTGPSLSTDATATAQSFFKNNFKEGWFKTTSVVFTPTKTTESQVSATATAIVPMTIMTMFGMPARTVNVTCEARYDVADADIVFVLDTTGSMACLTSDPSATCTTYAGSNVVSDGSGGYTVTEKSSSRISGLRSAVSSFYTTLTTGADPTTHFRFGFVPYNATVNVGHLLPRSYIADSWNYQSRWYTTGADVNTGSSWKDPAFASTKAVCDAKAGKSAYDASDTATTYTPNYDSTTGKCTVTNQKVHPTYHYAQRLNLDVATYASFSPAVNPAKRDNSSTTWAGCIEERDPDGALVTNPSASSPPLDLDVDTAPYDAHSKWGPLWPEVEYWRNTSGAAEDTAAVRTTLTRSGGDIAAAYNEVPCPKPAQRLQSMTAADITSYLSASNGFRPYGVTYHDVGMTWGTRLLSPNGIFASDTAAWAGHNPPNRYIVFLTDGDMEPDQNAYASHGMENFDKRVTGGSFSNLETYHNRRFTTACQIAKNHNITIFVIAYAQVKTPELIACASPGQDYYASDTTTLNDAFSKIAKQVAMLRISK